VVLPIDILIYSSTSVCSQIVLLLCGGLGRNKSDRTFCINEAGCSGRMPNSVGLNKSGTVATDKYKLEMCMGMGFPFPSDGNGNTNMPKMGMGMGRLA